LAFERLADERMEVVRDRDVAGWAGRVDVLVDEALVVATGCE
jgi:hypothetical protein